MVARLEHNAAPAPMQPLDGIRIADFSSNMAGPYATMILAHLGADVIKVEPPKGDDARSWPPFIDGMSVAHHHFGSGKRAIALDLKTQDGIAVAQALVARSDVVLQSMRPGVADRLGIGVAQARAANPDILYYDLSAFGSGPLGQSMPGYDPLVQAFTGIMEMTGHEGSPPTRCAPSLIDLGTGQWIAMGVLAAMLARGRGQSVGHLDTALVDTAFSIVAYQATAARVSGQRPPRAGSGNPIAAPYQCYRARDADLLVAAPSQRLWLAVVRAIAAPALATDPRFCTVAARSDNRKALESQINALLAARDVDDWISRFQAEGVPVARVQGLEQAVTSDIVAERGTFAEAAGVPLVRLPWRVDGATLPWRSRAPRLGEHSVEILRELGYGPADIGSLLESGAIVADVAANTTNPD
ncbi:CoA transferase [Verticiella sediminum]|uniref:CoA transferase n=1 Tax=Verticiella sediminum TaxID=1247510 RepID=A0A556AGL1_9BURK|nr:CoA transferase [Verticiella sediminum]TSH92024.1 CoA transferase [Verticiella sediminum]